MQDHIKKYFEVKKSGHNAVAKCPFHSDSSPSLYIYPDNYHCFACKAHGNIIDFEMHQKSFSFREAVLSLGQQYQIEIILENEGKRDVVQEKLLQLFQKTDKLHQKLKHEYDQNTHAEMGQKLKEFFPELGFLKNIKTLQEWGWHEKIELSKEYQTSFYTLPYQTERGDVFGFYFFYYEENSQINLPIEKYNFTLILSDRFQPILNFPQARRQTKSKELVVATDLFDACFLMKHNINNVALIRPNNITDGFFHYLSKYIVKIYFVLADNTQTISPSQKIKSFVRWVPSQLNEKINTYRLLNADSISDWLLTSAKSNSAAKENTSHVTAAKHKTNSEDQKKNQVFLKTTKFYHQILLQETSEHVVEYLKNRGIEKKDITDWQLGFCPRESALTNSVLKYKMDESAFVAVELLRFSEKNKRYYDFFYNRLIIPIMNHAGDYVALGGRVFDSLDTKSPKYINSAESFLFSKSKILYNYYQATQAIIEAGHVVVVEGFMDCIMLVKNGIKNTVAVMGTALTTEHLEALTQITKRVILCFDTDSAGQNAVQKSFLSNFKTPRLSLEVLTLPYEKDPDSFVRKHGAEKFTNLVADQTESIDEYVLNYIQKKSTDNDEFIENLKLIFKHVEIDKKSFAGQNFVKCLREKYNIKGYDVFAKVHTSYNSDKQKTQEHNSTIVSESIEELNAPLWSVKNAFEIKILITFFYTNFLDLPVKLKNILLGLPGSNEDDGVFIEAYSHQVSDIGRSVLNELFSYCLEQNYHSCCEITEEDIPKFTIETGVLASFLKHSSNFLLKQELSFLLDSHSLLGPNFKTKFDITNVWSLKNLAFLKLQRKNAELSQKFNTLTAGLVELLVHLEILEIDSQLKVYSRTHFNHEISEKFNHLMQARSTRQLLLIGIPS